MFVVCDLRLLEWYVNEGYDIIKKIRFVIFCDDRQRQQKQRVIEYTQRFDLEMACKSNGCQVNHAIYIK